MKILAPGFLLAALLFPATALANEFLPSLQSSRRTKNDDGPGRIWNDVRFLDIFGFRGGLLYGFLEGDAEIDKAGSIGDSVDFDSDLGLDSPDTIFPIVETYLQYDFEGGPALRLEAYYYWHRFEGNGDFDQDVMFEGWTIPQGTTFDSSLDFTNGGLNLTITPYVIKATDLLQIRLSIYGGALWTRWIIRLDNLSDPSIGDNAQIKDELSATLGHIGAHLEVRLVSLRAYGWFSGLQFNRNELWANYYDGGAGIKWEILPFLLVHGELSIMRARLDRNDQYRFDFQLAGPSFYVVLKY